MFTSIGADMKAMAIGLCMDVSMLGLVLLLELN